MMAEKKQTKKETDAISEFFQAQLAAAKRVTGDANSYVATEHSMRVVPIPPISLQWLINSNGWPLGRATSCAGDPKTFKSTFSYQLASWFMDYGGLCNIIDTENKQNGKTMEAIIGGTELADKYATFRDRKISSTEKDKVLLTFTDARRLD
jgi:hypothetical protein